MDGVERLIVELGVPGPDRPTLAEVGGKALNLDVLAAAGLPVPPTRVVTTAAYARFVADGPVRDLIDGLLREEGAGGGPSDDAVDAVFAAAPMPDMVRSALAELAASLEGAVAVRSSSTAEDLGGASFAGQHRSFLGVGPDTLDAAVRSVWASLWHASPRAYRAARGLREEPTMAVAVQEMVAAVRAGVCFTVDPIDPGGRVRVESVEGLGEALVSGAVTPQVVLVDRDHPGGSDPLTASVAELALRAEELFGAPQDVEWAWDGEATWLVQSRAITTSRDAGDGGDDVLAPDRRYTTAGIGEMAPGVLPRLVWDGVGLVLDEAFRAAFGDLGAHLVGERPLLVRTHGRVALDLDTLRELASQLPGSVADDLEVAYLGEVRRGDAPVATLPARAALAGLWRRSRHVGRVISAHHRALREQAITTAAVAAVLRADPQVEGRSVDELWALRHRLMALAARTAAAELAVAAAAVASSTRLEAQLVKYLGHDGVGWARAVTSDLAPTTAISLAADVATRLGAAEPVVLGVPWPDTVVRLQAAGRDDLLADLLVAARRAGCRSVFTGPTWAEAPERFWDLVVGLARRGDVGALGHRDVDDLERHLAARPGWLRTRILTGQIVDVRMIVVRRLVTDTVTLLAGRESAKAALLALGGVIRRIDLELGERLVVAGRLAGSSEVVHLATAELATMLSGRAGPTPAEIARRRRAVERWEAEEELPSFFLGAPSAPQRPLPAGDRMQGWGASAGRHTGAVRVMRRPRPALVQPGDVVVAARTDASWTPVFLRAGALVVEEGGPLSHAAIVARELGLPAVVNVPGVVEWLRSGAEPVTVTIDGDEGTIVRHATTRLAEVA